MVENTRIECIMGCVLEAVALLNDRLVQKVDLSLRDKAPLYGEQGGLDSISLVSLIADLEEMIEERLEVGIVLASERAFSRTKSPFRNIGELTQYIDELVEEKLCRDKLR